MIPNTTAFYYTINMPKEEIYERVMQMFDVTENYIDEVLSERNPQ